MTALFALLLCKSEVSCNKKNFKSLHWQSGLRNEIWNNGGSEHRTNFDLKQTEINVSKNR